MLAISGLDVAYGGLRALREVSLEVREGEFVTIVGRNGAGKTTLFKTISGTVAAAAGRIAYDGHDLLRVPAAARARLGIAHVPEGRQVFRAMTVMENLEMGALSPVARERCTTISPASWRSFRSSPSGGAGSRARSRAASGRCSPSGAASRRVCIEGAEGAPARGRSRGEAILREGGVPSRGPRRPSILSMLVETVSEWLLGPGLAHNGTRVEAEPLLGGHRSLRVELARLDRRLVESGRDPDAGPLSCPSTAATPSAPLEPASRSAAAWR